MKSPELERFEERGFFLTIPFPDEDDSTVLYIADQDFETLHEMLDSPDTNWESFRDELIELIEHSGHEGDHSFTKELTESLMNVIADREPPEETSIDDPLEDSNLSQTDVENEI